MRLHDIASKKLMPILHTIMESQADLIMCPVFDILAGI